jgi:hypothetical protein
MCPARISARTLAIHKAFRGISLSLQAWWYLGVGHDRLVPNSLQSVTLPLDAKQFNYWQSYLHKVTKKISHYSTANLWEKAAISNTAFRSPLVRRYAMPHHKGEETQITAIVHPNHWTETSRATPRYEKLPRHDGELRFEIRLCFLLHNAFMHFNMEYSRILNVVIRK